MKWISYIDEYSHLGDDTIEDIRKDAIEEAKGWYDAEHDSEEILELYATLIDRAYLAGKRDGYTKDKIIQPCVLYGLKDKSYCPEYGSLDCPITMEENIQCDHTLSYLEDAAPSSAFNRNAYVFDKNK